MGFMNAAFGVRFFPEDLRRVLRPPAFLAVFLPRLDDFRDDFREDFLPPFFLVAILSPGLVIRDGICYRVKRGLSATQTIVLQGECNRETTEFPYEESTFSEGKSTVFGRAVPDRPS